MADLLSSIGIQPISLAGQIVSFLILYFVFKKFLFGPVLKNLDKRAEKEKQAMKAAENTIRIKEEIQAEQQKEREKLQKQIRAEMEEARKEAELQKADIIKTAKVQAEKAARNEYENYNRELLKQQEQVKKDISQLVIQTAKKVLSEHLKGSAQEKIVDAQIDKLKNLKF